MLLPEIHGYPVIAFVRSEVQFDSQGKEKECGMIIVELRPTEPADQLEWGHYVTAWYREGDLEWTHGNYFEGERALKRAWNDFALRVVRFGVR